MGTSWTCKASPDCSGTEDEYRQREAFHGRCIAATKDAAVVGAPGWFAPAMAAAMAPINARLENRLDNIDARQRNSVAGDMGDTLVPLNNAMGVQLPIFSSTLRH